MEDQKNNGQEGQKETQWPLWEVFVQKKPGTPHKHVGSVHAPDPEMALQNARDVYTRRNEGTSIWVIPGHSIIASTPDEQGEFFDPANDKVYRHPTFYHIPEGVKYI